VESGWTLSAEVRGERIDRSRHLFETEVKAVTLHRFEVRNCGNRDVKQTDADNEDWMIQAILDV